MNESASASDLERFFALSEQAHSRSRVERLEGNRIGSVRMLWGDAAVLFPNLQIGVCGCVGRPEGRRRLGGEPPTVFAYWVQNESYRASTHPNRTDLGQKPRCSRAAPAR